MALETDGIILHCDESYKPCGVTAPVERVIDQRAFPHQVSQPKRLNERPWQRLLRGKTVNQQRVLERKQLHSPHLELALKSGAIDKGNCVRLALCDAMPPAKIGLTSSNLSAALVSADALRNAFSGCAKRRPSSLACMAWHGGKALPKH